MANPSLSEMQRIVGTWALRNFGVDKREGVNSLHCALGVAEEAGELCHAILKRDQGIRGTREEHDEAAKDAACDIIIYLMDLCCREGWDLQSSLTKTVERVTSRDWKSDPQSGGEAQ